MKIRELFESNDNSEEIKLLGALEQVRGRIKDTGATSKISLEALLASLSKLGINLDEKQFREMSAQEPLKNIIANVAGDKVVFIGQSDSDTDALDTDNTSSTLEKMAKRAAKK